MTKTTSQQSWLEHDQLHNGNKSDVPARLNNRKQTDMMESFLVLVLIVWLWIQATTAVLAAVCKRRNNYGSNEVPTSFCRHTPNSAKSTKSTIRVRLASKMLFWKYKTRKQKYFVSGFEFRVLYLWKYKSTIKQGSGNTYRGLLFLVFGGTSQLTGIPYLLQTVMWYISPSWVRLVKKRFRFW